MSLYTVGGLFDPDKTSWKEGTGYTYAADQHMIKLVWKRLTLAEVAAVDHGKLQFALFTEDDQIILFLKLGEVSGWSEMPYTVWRVHETTGLCQRNVIQRSMQASPSFWFKQKPGASLPCVFSPYPRP